MQSNRKLMAELVEIAHNQLTMQLQRIANAASTAENGIKQKICLTLRRTSKTPVKRRFFYYTIGMLHPYDNNICL